jgi:FMNH2-dependent dimethyl sulfone monooxygenase
VAGYVVCRDTEGGGAARGRAHHHVAAGCTGFENFGQWQNGTQLEQRLKLEDYSVSNRGLRSGLVGTPDQIAARIREFESAGAELLLLQFSPQAEEMERFAEQVMPRVRSAASAVRPASPRLETHPRPASSHPRAAAARHAP